MTLAAVFLIRSSVVLVVPMTPSRAYAGMPSRFGFSSWQIAVILVAALTPVIVTSCSP